MYLEHHMLDDYTSDAQRTLEQIEKLDNLIYALDEPNVDLRADVIKDKYRLLTGVSDLPVALESFDCDLEAAVESVFHHAQQEAIKWANKILDSAKGLYNRVMSTVSPIVKQIGEKAEKLSHYTWDKAQEATKYAKAHPYRTVIAAVAAIGAATALYMYLGNSCRDGVSSPEKVKPFLKNVAQKAESIKSPNVEIKAEVISDGSTMTTTYRVIDTPVPEEKLTTLGWTAQTIGNIGKTVGAAFGSFSRSAMAVGQGLKQTAQETATFTTNAATRTASGLNAVGGKVFKYSSNAASRAGTATGKANMRTHRAKSFGIIAGKVIAKLIVLVLRICLNVVVGALHLILGTLRGIGSVLLSIGAPIEN